MTQQFWIGGIYIDLTRNEITQNNESKTLAPQMLSVLTYLAQNQGKVVSQDELLSEVWQGAVVAPNTLQRSIARLRKALGDDGKEQTYIKTHSKKGYSLECTVRWLHESDEENQQQASVHTNSHYTGDEKALKENTSNEIKANPKNKADSGTSEPSVFSHINLSFSLLLIIILGLVAIRMLETKPVPQLNVVEFRAITDTDNKEIMGSYSPDGQYVVFHRYEGEFCHNNMWARNIETQQEFRLTKSFDSYGAHSFSKDGKELVFIQSTNCAQPVTQKTCYHLMSLNFDDALNSPQSPRLLLECKNTEIKDPHWLNNNNVAMLQQLEGRWKLINYSITQDTSETLYHLPDGNLLTYDYSPKDDLFALVSLKQDGKYYIEMLKSNGELVSSHQINYPEEIAKFETINPKFSPFENQLIFSTGRRMFTLSYDGEIKNLGLPIEQPMSTPKFHPTGDRLLVTKGNYDSDIMSMSLTLSGSGGTAEEAYSVLQRSNKGEYNGVFQPNGNLMAYKTARTGQGQIWLLDNNIPQQFSNFPIDVYIYEFYWASDGESVLANVDKELHQLFLNKTEKSYAFEHPVNTLFDWDSKEQTALAVMRVKDVLKFVELDLTNESFQVLNDRRVSWAGKTSDGRIVYTDQLDRYWITGSVEDQMIEALQEQGSDKRFVIHEDVIYGVNETLQLWSYDLNDETFEVLGDVPRKIDYLTDVNDTHALMSVRVMARKEVAELLLAK